LRHQLEKARGREIANRVQRAVQLLVFPDRLARALSARILAWPKTHRWQIIRQRVQRFPHLRVGRIGFIRHRVLQHERERRGQVDDRTGPAQFVLSHQRLEPRSLGEIDRAAPKGPHAVIRTRQTDDAELRERGAGEEVIGESSNGIAHLVINTARSLASLHMDATKVQIRRCLCGGKDFVTVSHNDHHVGS
jgi:hypothetical protein